MTSLTSAADLVRRPISQPDFIIDGLLAAGSFLILAGEAKSGKTAFATTLGLAVSSGSDFLGQAVAKSPVLWIAAEESEAERAELLAQHDSKLTKGNFQVSFEAPKLDSGEGLMRLEELRAKIGARLVVIDPLAACLERLGSNDRARSAVSGLHRWAGQTGTAVLAIHHLAKGKKRPTSNQVLGGGQVLAAASAHWLFWLEHQFDDGSRVNGLRRMGRGSWNQGEVLLYSEEVGQYGAKFGGSDFVESEVRRMKLVEAN